MAALPPNYRREGARHPQNPQAPENKLSQARENK